MEVGANHLHSSVGDSTHVFASCFILSVSWAATTRHLSSDLWCVCVCVCLEQSSTPYVCILSVIISQIMLSTTTLHLHQCTSPHPEKAVWACIKKMYVINEIVRVKSFPSPLTSPLHTPNDQGDTHCSGAYQQPSNSISHWRLVGVG